LDALKNNYVYLSNPKDFNDPFDCNRNLIIEKQKEIQEWQYVEKLMIFQKLEYLVFRRME